MERSPLINREILVKTGVFLGILVLITATGDRMGTVPCVAVVEQKTQRLKQEVIHAGSRQNKASWDTWKTVTGEPFRPLPKKREVHRDN